MSKCKECETDNWEIVVAYLKKEEGKWLHLWQCYNCKRVVCATDDDMEQEGKI